MAIYVTDKHILFRWAGCWRSRLRLAGFRAMRIRRRLARRRAMISPRGALACRRRPFKSRLPRMARGRGGAVKRCSSRADVTSRKLATGFARSPSAGSAAKGAQVLISFSIDSRDAGYAGVAMAKSCRGSHCLAIVSAALG